MHERYDELLPIYALGALDGEDLAAIEAHLAAGCEECARELMRYERAASALAFAAAPASPPASLRARALAGAAPEARSPKAGSVVPFPAGAGRPERPAWGSATGILATAAALVRAAGIAITYLAWSLTAAGRRLDEQIRQLDALRQQVAEQDHELAERDRQLALIRDPEVRVVSLGDPAEERRPGVEVIWHPEQKRGLLLARGLERVAPDKTYELWLIADNKPVPAAVFNVDETGSAVVELDQLPGAATPEMFAVTVEPAGGRDTPTLPIRYAGKYPTG
jgi:anti-sigma-K factor RskA